MFPRITTFFVLAGSAVALVPACAHQIHSDGTTTLTSATPSAGGSDGVRVTNTRPERADVIHRLAEEMCRREAACNAIGEGKRYRTEETCMADQSSRAPATVSRWGCTPTRAQPGLEDCLAAIRSERCESPLPRADGIPACGSRAVCGS